ncbi:PREDICTED: TLC domain-containing protein 2 [Tarenaya hassleriana]|uniref:TLC domain-containing protein 2 n=1 Tax=Tarenaya hassleriana TaxID=28532 RepID=UPI00053C8F24|nr:PREDICTED: TLC domain-containing protein 2 [Tarenaya hassleriana]
MARTAMGAKSRAGEFFLATLVLWLVSVVFEIVFNRRTELLFVICGVFFFQSANWVVRSCLSRDPLFVNTSVSLFHSIIVSASVVFILANQWLTKGPGVMFEHSQLVDGTWQWAYQALCFSCGYFAYDQWDMLQYRLYSGFVPSILVHHLVLLVCFTLALYRNVAINYLILTLICELHSVFLHVRKLRRMAGIRDSSSTMVKLEWALNWTTFVLARSIPHVLITIKLIRDASKFGKGIEWPLALFGMVGMHFLNMGLGIDLFHAFRRERNQQSNHHSHGE